MEIVSGILKGLQLRAPAGMATRPTSVRARQAFFDSLGPLDGLFFADIFAGSGAVGLEAASRGASGVVFADSSSAACSSIKKNIEAAERRCACEFKLVSCELPSGAKRLPFTFRPSYIFADPPYAESVKLLDSLLRSPDFTGWAKGAKLIWEMAPESGGMLPPPETWSLDNIRVYGSAKFIFLSCG